MILFILFSLFNASLSFSQEKIDRPVYQLENENLQTVPHSYFQYLEGVDHTIPFKELNLVNGQITCKPHNHFTMVTG